VNPDDPFPDLASRALDEGDLPSVAELVDAVAQSAGIPFERRGDLFPAVQRVHAEERRMIQTGFEPSSLDELVARSIPLLPPDLGGGRFAGRGWGEEAPFEDEPLPPLPSLPGPDDPFVAEEFDRRAAALVRRDPEPGNETLRESEPAEDARNAAESETEDPEAEEPEDDLEPTRDFAREHASPRREGRLVTFLLLVAIAGGVWFFARSRRLPPTPASPAADSGNGSAEPPAPSPSPGPAGGETSVASPRATAPEAAPQPAPVLPGKAPETALLPPSPTLPESTGSSILTSNWTGSPVYMIHFSSYQKKENADRDVARLSKLLGRPLRAVAVNIGRGAIWYRVMLGEFSSREEADAARGELAARGAPGMGLVYRVSSAAR